jgi:hypothetical protein
MKTKSRVRMANAAIEAAVCESVYVHPYARMLKRICEVHKVRVRADQEQIEVLLRCYYA